MDTRLILVDGCPGLGKSSTAQALCRRLQGAGHPCRWYYEEEQPHPVAATRGIANAKGFRAFGTSVLKRWRDFASRARRSKEISLVEARFFQDVITPLLRADVKPERTHKLVHRMAEFCAPLKPVLIYLHQPDCGAAMRRILDERGSRIEERYIRHATASPYGQRRGLEGFEGLVQAWLDARAIMEQLLDTLELPTLRIDNTEGDWEAYYRQIGDFLDAPLAPGPGLSAAELAEYAGTYTYRRDTMPRRAGGTTRFGTVNVQRRVGGLPRQGALHHHKDVEFTIQVERGELVMGDYGWLWPTNRLIPLRRDVFDLRSWPFQMHFERDRTGAIVAASRKSETTRWMVTGQRYPRLEHPPTSSPTS